MEIDIEEEAEYIARLWCRTPDDYYEAKAAIIDLCQRIYTSIYLNEELNKET